MTEIRALVADDDPQLLDIMERRLRKAGLEPDRAKNGRAAIALIERTDYDLIVTDIYMPGATGLALLRKAKERDAHVQVVVVTAGATLDNAIEALNEGAFGYLAKPFDHISVFDNMIARALEFRRLILDNQRMAEAQKRRGDMLEEEVTDRVQQLRVRQRQLIDLLGALPDGVVLVEEGGRVVMSSPVAEKWLAQELRSGGQPIQRFIEKVHSEFAEEEAEVQIGSDVLLLTAVELPSYDDTSRKVVVIRELEHEAPDYAPKLYNPLLNLKKGLGWLYRHRKMGEVSGLLEYLALQLADIEKFSGLSIETGDQTEADLSEMLQAEGTPPAMPEVEALEASPPAGFEGPEAALIPEKPVEDVGTSPELEIQSTTDTLPGVHIVDFEGVDAEPESKPEPVLEPEPEPKPEPVQRPKGRSAPLRLMFQKAAQIAKTKRLSQEEMQAAVKEGAEAASKGQDEAFDTLISMLDESKKSTTGEPDEKQPPASEQAQVEEGEASGEETHPGKSTSKDDTWPPPPPSEG